jgi:hypothetical protein
LHINVVEMLDFWQSHGGRTTHRVHARSTFGGLTLLADITAKQRGCGRSATLSEPFSLPVGPLVKRCIAVYTGPLNESDRSGKLELLRTMNEHVVTRDTIAVIHKTAARPLSQVRGSRSLAQYRGSRATQSSPNHSRNDFQPVDDGTVIMGLSLTHRLIWLAMPVTAVATVSSLLVYFVLRTQSLLDAQRQSDKFLWQAWIYVLMEGTLLGRCPNEHAMPSCQQDSNTSLSVPSILPYLLRVIAIRMPVKRARLCTDQDVEIAFYV